MKILPIILAGGSGTRLWPLSRNSFPKQFLTLVGDHSLFQETVLRAGKLTGVLEPLVVCNESHYFVCQEQLAAIHQQQAHFLLEPVGKNTAPAIAAAALYAQQHFEPDTLLLVLPSDHLIADEQAFLDACENATEVAHEKLVTFGITPTAPKTGFGYIEAGDACNDNTKIITRFVEKPSLDVAQSYLDAGNFYWNSGMFMLSSNHYLTELANHANDILRAVKHAYEQGEIRDNYLHLDRAAFADCRSESIDYAVMESTKEAVIIPLASPWSDLGDWSAIAEASTPDADENIIQGDVIVQDCEGCFLTTDSQLLATAGLKNLIVVATRDAVLVADKAHSQQVKALVQQLGNNPVATEHKLMRRPWGFYESIASGDNFQVKRISVNPGASLSLQLHHHRSEHWVITEGIAEVTCGEDAFTLEQGESTFIPKETKHRLSNKTGKPLLMIEVQLGSYLGEDDIVRFDDAYGRKSQK